MPGKPTPSLSIADLIAKRERSLPVAITDQDGTVFDTITVRYRPDAYTKSLEAKWQAAMAEERHAEAACDFLTPILCGWDFADPCTPENIERLGLLLQAQIAEALMADMSDEGKASSGGSGGG